MGGNKNDDYLNRWVEDKKLAVRSIPLIYDLWVERSVELLLFRKRLVSLGPVEILKFHDYGRQISHKEFGITETLPIIEALSVMDLCPSRIDIGTLASEWTEADQSKLDLKEFLRDKLKEHLKPGAGKFEPRDVVLYGFGRIGRIMARILINEQGGGDALRLRAVVSRKTDDLEKRANLLKRDSVHGSFRGNIRVLPEEEGILANGTLIKFIKASAPDQIDYTAHGIETALILDNTGVWRDREGLSLHLKAQGAERVLLTAPGRGDVPNIVYGINHRGWAEEERIFSAASCTTNAIVPPLKVLNDTFGIEYAHVETVHAYTNDQNLLDNFHPKKRRGRSAPLNMVITETGAATAISKALPELSGKVTGSAVRVPTPNVSLAILDLDLKKQASRDEINEALRLASLKGPLVAQIDFTRDQEVVSTDMVGNPHPAIVDSLATITHGNKATVYVWY
ncbi:MAG: glyceraldehyde-3-phosphate dehydrogenase, partial [bacterium]|nr:glyceraldehyde-3-phosphate dehydrogenase [bacterium]